MSDLIIYRVCSVPLKEVNNTEYIVANNYLRAIEIHEEKYPEYKDGFHLCEPVNYLKNIINITEEGIVKEINE